MCGICGILNVSGSPVEASRITNMLDRIRHRGPDDSGIYTNGMIGLGHARLSIIDLTGGHQPMHNAEGTVSITFNGEIFNYLELRRELEQNGHEFKTNSDTEVIIHLYEEEGENCVRRFNGQWAFALWDARRQKLFLSRDRLGVRPLFYARTRNSFYFASEIKALLASPEISREIDLRGLNQIFTFWAPVPPRTTFREVSQLPPGCSLTIEDGRCTVEPYWSPAYAPIPCQDSGRESQLGQELLELLQDATHVRLRADVPVGAYLSGGIDSTVTTALAQTLAGNRLRSFSITFADSEFDESTFQKEASSRLGTKHTNISCSRSDIAHVFPEVIWHAEQPVLSYGAGPDVSALKIGAREWLQGGLTGEGADEILGGYDLFKETKIRLFWAQNLHSRWRPLLLKCLYPYMHDLQRQSPEYLQQFFRVNEQNLASPFFSHLPRWELTSRLQLLLSREVLAELRSHNPVQELEACLPASYHSWSPFNRAEYLELKLLLPGYILSAQGDRMAMAHSVEGRYPFLDHRVVEFASQLPPHLKMKVLTEKYLLKQATGHMIPSSIMRRTKQPYRAPDGKSFFGPDAPEYVQELLSETAIGDQGIFDREAVGALVRKFRSGRASSTKDNMALIGVLSTQLLLHQFSNQERRPYEPCAQLTSNLKSTISS